MKQTYLGFEGLKNKITTLNQSASSVGWGVKQELMDQLESQFQDILQMQKEDFALEEYNEETKKHKSKQQKRGGSLAYRKKAKEYD